jgi:hypothetical protein
MATTAQINANRANASRSTGPASAAGKAASSQNGLKHGLASSQLIVPGESEVEFNTFLAGLLAEHQPQSLTETLLVQDMAKYHWLADRALRMQSDAIAKEAGALPPSLGLLIRYQTANQRAFQKSLATLTALRKTRLAEIGSASKKASQAASAAYAEAKRQSQERLAAILRDCAAPRTEKQLIADGFVKNPDTGNWEKTIG